ncbi:ABC transporter ATP-binding protein [Pseudonocardia zijingensis]|uniref:ABC transporter ATP-binding protein n=1 Tax=Pseudonocardia zijingensis TaxID=153376 RepID=A0ABP3YLS0_9PSEU
MLRLDGVGKQFRARWALRDCSLELPPGRVCALVGPNGAGKTTLLTLATGLRRPSSGRIDVLGHDPARTGMPTGASFVAQHKPLYRSFRVVEMLRAAAALNVTGQWDGAYTARLVDQAGIGLQERVRELSAGQRARIALAIALGRRPSLLLLDEPLAELDPLARRQVLGTLLAEAAETGMTVLMSSHVLADLEDACDHLVLLRHGRVRLAGDIDALLDTHRRLSGRARDTLPRTAVVHTSTTARQTTALVRGPGDTPTGFQVDRPSLEDVVLAYLQEAEDAA